MTWTGPTTHVLASYGRDTIARAVSGTGIVVGSLGLAPGRRIDEAGYAGHAARWKTPDHLVDLGTLPGYSSSAAYGVNDNAVTVGVARGEDKPDRAVRWSRNGVLVALQQLPGAIASHADDINNQGVIVGTVTTADNVDHPVAWDAHGVISELPSPAELSDCLDRPEDIVTDNCYFRGPLAINSAGDVAGAYDYRNAVSENLVGVTTIWTAAG